MLNRGGLAVFAPFGLSGAAIGSQDTDAFGQLQEQLGLLAGCT